MTFSQQLEPVWPYGHFTLPAQFGADVADNHSNSFSPKEIELPQRHSTIPAI